MRGLPVTGRDHPNRIPGTAIEKNPVRPLADAFRAPDARGLIHFNAAEGRMVCIRHPEHAHIDRTINDAKLGDPAHPVQYSLMTARVFGLRLRRSVRPCDIGSSLRM